LQLFLAHGCNPYLLVDLVGLPPGNPPGNPPV